ncbi:unnamed protein product [Adineta steineri]|uniref:Uncharacterized protein n=1 Tax=Adineta steineri TaxID=433720 RepID=A0A815DDU4_9BILA|nr:unnamed protein product [Adineta steineri]CAF1299516.1 unnamed protein product [Adineta steineri]CAF1299751.1 unnamed protein product [Adineta steineri]CAF1402605.1 unnamed protein product [Adineta steineri]
MQGYKRTSEAFIDRKRQTFKSSNVTLINEQNEIIHHDILNSIVQYDPKLDFTCIPIMTHDPILKYIRRQTYGLIWNSIRSPTISKLVQNDRSYAFVEILQIPKTWSRYDIDILLLKIQKKNFLNGLVLRDEFVRVLQIVLKNNYSYKFYNINFTRNTIQLIFHSQQETNVTLIISFILLIEFDIPCIKFFPADIYTSLCNHNDIEEYFKSNSDIKLTRLTSYNSIKFHFDYNITETKLCEYLLEKSNSLSLILNNFLKLRKQWLKYVPHVANIIKRQIHYRPSICSINSLQSITSNNSEFMPNNISLSKEIEMQFESLFSLSLIRLLFLTICSQYKQFDNYTIEHALELFNDALENNYLELPFLKNINTLPDCEINIKHGIKKIINEMQRDCKQQIYR